jgi:putative aminopeptidase FrvX
VQKEDEMEQKKYIVEILEKLVNIPSPSGFTKELMQLVEQEAKNFGYECEYIRKGGLLIHVPGAGNETVGLSAHGDTLGAMVRSITSQGTLKFTSVGGYTMNSIEGEYCKIHTREGKMFTGTILSTSPSVHTHDDARTIERKEKNMEVRIDEVVKSKDDVLALGINPGDYISFDARFEYTESGFIKSRHLDDKASVAVLLGLLKDMSEQKIIPAKTVKILISNLEEIGLGATYLPADIQEFIAVDMGALGDDLSGSEYAVSICALDSTGPYDYELTTKLINLAKEEQISYAVDIFPHYGSDASAAMRGGNNIRTALIGQGIHASHGMERTHDSALMATLSLLQAYIKAL